MMSDGIAGTPGGEKVKVLDIAELLLNRQTPAHENGVGNERSMSDGNSRADVVTDWRMKMRQLTR